MIPRSIYFTNIVYYSTMSTITLNMHEAKTRLSEIIARNKPGDRVVLCRRNVSEWRTPPVAARQAKP